MEILCLLLHLILIGDVRPDKNSSHIEAGSDPRISPVSAAPDKDISQASTKKKEDPETVLQKEPFRRLSEKKYSHILHEHQSKQATIAPILPSLSMSTDGGNVSTSKVVFVGRNTTLNCKVKGVNEETASWMRQEGEILKLVSYDTNVYASNERYELNFSSEEGWKSWRLIITRTTVDDAGLYRCQVASTPSLVMDVTLEVKEPSTRIVDDHSDDVSAKHYNSGSMIELRCLVTNVPFPHDQLLWMKDQKKLFFNTSKGGIKVKADSASHAMSSRLYIVKASSGDSGLYTCCYGNLSRAQISVHIITGENSAAMQHDAIVESNSAVALNLNFNMGYIGPILSTFGNIIYSIFSSITLDFVSMYLISQR